QRRGCCGWRRGGGRRGRYGGTDPYQHFTVFITRQPLALDEFHRQVFEEGIIQVKLPFEGAIGHPPAALEHGNRLIEDLFKVHQHASISVVLKFAILQWSPWALLLNHRDRLNFHHIIRARQSGDNEQRAGGGIGWEALLTHFAYRGGVVDVSDICGRLHNIVESATYGLDGGL